MKILKWLLYIVLLLLAVILILPLFFPSVVEISAEQEIAVSPAQVFHNAASYTDRNLWDPWLETEPDAAYSIESRPDYVGSEYTWNGDKIKAGRMVVDSVVFGRYIASSIYFGDTPEPSLVEWGLEGMDAGGTLITWKFTAGTAYPMERLMLNLFKGQMEASFSKGLENLKAYLEENPPILSSLGNIEKGLIAPMFSLLVEGRGTMDEMGVMMAELYGMLWAEMGTQGLEMAGAPFTHYLNFDESTGISDFLVGLPVSSIGKDAEGVISRVYPQMEVIQAMHYGPYDELSLSYEKIMEYISSNEIEVSGESIEFYLTDPGTQHNITKWETLIAFPLK